MTKPKDIKITLEQNGSLILGNRYRLSQMTNRVTVQVLQRVARVGEFLNEQEAEDLCAHYEVTIKAV